MVRLEPVCILNISVWDIIFRDRHASSTQEKSSDLLMKSDCYGVQMMLPFASNRSEPATLLLLPVDIWVGTSLVRLDDEAVRARLPGTGKRTLLRLCCWQASSTFC